MKNVSPSGKVIKAKPAVVPAAAPLLKAPEKKVNAFTALVAATAKADAKPATPAVAKPAAPADAPKAPAFQHTEKNGRSDYRPGTIGYRIFEACNALVAKTPNIALTADLLKVALPDVKKTSLGCGLSHWRQFNGRTKALMAAAAKAVPAK